MSTEWHDIGAVDEVTPQTPLSVKWPLHSARFHIPSGRHLDGPGNRNLECFSVNREGTRLLVRKND